MNFPFLKDKSLYFYIILAATVLMAFINLGSNPLSPWDESRNGINAIEMLVNGDWVNLYYAGKPDTWNTKPPLFIWIISASFYLFDYSELSLRLPSAIAIIISILVTFKVIVLYKSKEFAFWTCLILLSVKGIIGWHIGRTGDFDAPLMCFLLIAIYNFLLYFDFNKKPNIFYSGISFGLAFLIKGPAMFVLIPGLVLYIFLSKRLKDLLFKKEVWISIFICFSLPILWFLLIQNFGVTFQSSSSGSNVFETLFIQDVWERFTENESEWKKALSFDFFFYSLDKLFNLWHFLFFGFLAWLIFLFLKKEKLSNHFLLRSENKLILLSICLYLPLALFLTLAAKSHSWYLAPAIPFVGIVTYQAIELIVERSNFIKYLFYGLLAFTIGRNLITLNSFSPPPQIIIENKQYLSEAESLSIYGDFEQDILLYIYFVNQKLHFNPENPAGNILLFENQFLKENPIKGYRTHFKNTKYTIVEKLNQ